MDKDEIDLISEELGKVFANLQLNLQKLMMQHLMVDVKSASDVREWANKQAWQRIVFNKQMGKEISKYKKIIHKQVENANYLALKSSVKGDKAIEDGATNKVIANRTKINSKNMNEQIDDTMIKLVASMNLNYQQQINNVYQAVNKFNEEDVANKIFNQLSSQLNKTSVGNAPTVTYSDGKKFSYRSYMEMNVRTTLSQNATNFQHEVSQNLGVIFYICDTYADSEELHSHYQGKIYYDANYLSICPPKYLDAVQEYIDSHKLMSYQAVSEGKPYLTTRPNCRHRFMPLSTSEVLNKSVDSIIEENHLSTGKYKDSNYEKLKRQRYNERAIRKYKTRLEQNQQMLDNDPNNPTLQSAVKNDKDLIRSWQRKNNILVKENKGVLFRDYKRENINKVVNDLGYKYDAKNK